jgi:secreted trypsin-like serine protease
MRCIRFLYSIPLLTLTAIACQGRQANEASIPLIAYGERVKTSDPLALMSIALLAASPEDPEKFVPFCSGALIKSDLVVTAAHCIDGDSVTVGIGTDMSRPRQLIKGQTLRHESYDLPYNEPFSFDLALIKLSEPAPLPMQAAQLAGEQDIRPGQSLVLAGYGTTLQGDKPSINRKNKQLFKTSSELLRVYSRDDEELSEFGLIVSQSANQKSGACEGDSGGPVFIQTATEFKLAAITVGGMGRCNSAGFHTNLDFYKDWLIAAEKKLRE